MATTAGPFPIFYTPDVHNFYVKQKQEFHFNQKSDNEFLMFLLDTAVRVISIVQHLAPVIEAVSDASTDDAASNSMEIHALSTSTNCSEGMYVETALSSVHLTAELEQIKDELDNHQKIDQQQSRFSIQPKCIISSSQLSERIASLQTEAIKQPTVPPQSSLERQPTPVTHATPVTQAVTQAVTQTVTRTTPIPHSTPVIESKISRVPELQSAPGVLSATSSSESVSQTAPTPFDFLKPVTQRSSLAQSSESLATALPSVRQPVAEEPSSEEVVTEQPVPEVIDIKKEMDDSDDEISLAELVPPETFQHLMSSISGTEDISGLQNFVPTATPSSLPPSFLDRGSNNPLSMVGSMNSGDVPGSSDLDVPIIDGMNDISDALNRNERTNPISDRQCPVCGRVFYGRKNIKPHLERVHLKMKKYSCKTCGLKFYNKHDMQRHLICRGH